MDFLDGHAFMDLVSSLPPWPEYLPEQLKDAANLLDSNWQQFFGPRHPLAVKLPYVYPSFLVAFVLAYILFVTIVPVVFKAVNFSISLKPVMRLYNLFMVILSTYMGTRALYLAYQQYDSVWCVPLKGGDEGYDMAIMVWIFTYSKIIEFLDTVFMIFEGRWRQVSFLHVYHHISISLYWMAILWVAPGSDGYFSLAINSYIHVIMYGYYFLASIGINPWWKYYITYMQLLQFVSFCGQSIYVGYVKTDAVCDFPNVLSRGLLWYMLTLIVLFGNFLVQNKFAKKNSKTNINNNNVDKAKLQ